MKSRYLPLAGLLLIGILGASGSTAAASIENRISAAKIIDNARITRNIDIHQRNIIGIIADQHEIEPEISGRAINNIRLNGSRISDISLIAIGNIINDDIQNNHIESGEITA